MFLQGDGCDFPLSFHFVNNQGNHGKVKPTGRRVEIKGQFTPVLEGNMKLKLIQIDCYGMSFGVFPHLFSSPKSYWNNRSFYRKWKFFKKCHGAVP